MTYRLVESLHATADANGRAVAFTSPPRYGEEWNITNMTTESDSAAETELRVYKGDERARELLATTCTGNSDTADGAPVALPFNQKLTVVWSNATAGARCKLTIEGKKTFHGIR